MFVIWNIYLSGVIINAKREFYLPYIITMCMSQLRKKLILGSYDLVSLQVDRRLRENNGKLDSSFACNMHKKAVRSLVYFFVNLHFLHGIT